MKFQWNFKYWLELTPTDWVISGSWLILALSMHGWAHLLLKFWWNVTKFRVKCWNFSEILGPDRGKWNSISLGVLGFSHQRSGLGVVLSVSINSAPSKGPDTTLVPWKLTRMVAGTQYPWDLTATSYIPPPLAPPDRPDSQSQNFWTWFARKVSKYAPESPFREELKSGLGPIRSL